MESYLGNIGVWYKSVESNTEFNFEQEIKFKVGNVCVGQSHLFWTQNPLEYKKQIKESQTELNYSFLVLDLKTCKF